RDTILWTSRYAASAHNFLYEDDSEKTAAFIGWFGVSNMNKAQYIRQEIHDPIYYLGSGAKYYVADLEDLDDTLVIGCGSARNTEDCRKRGTVFVANKLSNTIVVCPVHFFNNGAVASDAAEQESVTAWRSQRTLVPAAGFALLHEMTHITAVVDDFEYWKDGLASTDVAYEPSECIKLPDMGQINNAQNYALFALDVSANPEYAGKQVDVRGDEDDKWQFAVSWLRNGVGGRKEQP
ncbi:Neutral protease 2-like protein MEP5, partial [Colletotrichum shisoi]